MISFGGTPPYPPSSSPDQLFPYPPPALGEYTSPSSNIDTAQMDEALIEDAKMYASASGVSFDDAIERLMLQGIVEDINIKLKTGESSTFAGLWIQHKPDYRVIVRFTNNGNTTIKPYIQNTSLADIVEVQTADVSLEELRSVQLHVSQIMSQSNIPFMSGINVIENSVELNVLNTDEVVAFLQDTKMSLPAHTRIIKFNELGKEVEHIFGGLALSTCTSGFSVTNAYGVKGVTTAGHCIDDQWFNGVNLPCLGEDTSGEYDIQWHRGDHAFNVINWINDGLVGRAILGEKLRDSQVLGDFVCKNGKETGYMCGFIAQVYVNGINVRVDNITVV